MLDTKSILVAGATGFIGSYLVDELSKSFDVIAYGRTLKRETPKSVREKIINININQDQKKLFEVDYLINCIGFTDTSSNNWSKFYTSNCLTTYSLLKNIRYKNFIQLSSFSIFSKNSLNHNQPDPINFYGLSKYLAEKVVEIEHTGEKTSSILRFPIVIGKSKTHKDFVNYIYDRAKFGDTIELYNSGMFLRDVIHISEAVKAVISLVKTDDLQGFNIFNIGCLNAISVLDICKHILDKTTSKSRIDFVDHQSSNDFDSLVKFNKSSRISYTSLSIEKNLDLFLESEY